MIDTVITIRWLAPLSNGAIIGHTTSPLPEELLFLQTPENRRLCNKVLTCPCCGEEGVALLLGFGFLRAALFLPQSPALFCTKHCHLVLRSEDIESIRRRANFLASTRWKPLRDRTFATGSRLLRPCFTNNAKRLLFGDESAILLEEDVLPEVQPPAIRSKVVSGGMFCDIPDQIAFYGTQRPEVLALTLEPATRCNFSCGFCYGRHIDQGILTLSDFRAIIDRFPGLPAVELTGEGEPLMNRHLFEMLALLQSRSIWSHITTNGSVARLDVYERLISNGLSSLAFSLESCDPAKYARLRPGGNFEDFLQSVKFAVASRKRLDARMEIRFWVTIHKETVEELPRIKRLAGELGIDLVEYQVLNPMEAYRRFYSEELQANMLSVQEMVAICRDESYDVDVRQAIRSVLNSYRGKRCDVYMDSAMVNWKGQVTPCRLLKTPAFEALGNLIEQSFDEVWDNLRFRLFRFALQHGIILRSCEGCPTVTGFSVPTEMQNALPTANLDYLKEIKRNWLGDGPNQSLADIHGKAPE